MHNDIVTYNNSQLPSDKAICVLLSKVISDELPDAENKVWHGHPVWFLDGNPIVGYAKRKKDMQLLFWSGQSFEEPGLEIEGTFKAAQKRFTHTDEINADDLRRWLKKAREVQWDYKHIIKNRGILNRLK